MKSMKVSNIIKVIKPDYVYLKLKPNNSIRNNETNKLARAISSLYKNVFENVKKEQEKLVSFFGKDIGIGTEYSYRTNEKVSYYIYLEKKKVEFYFIVPKQHLAFIKEKIGSVWSNITIEQVTVLPQFEDSATRYQLVYEKEDGLSLTTDRRDNDLLNSNLNCVEMLEEGDKVGIFYNFIPVEQNSWKFSYRNTIEKVKRGLPVNRNKFGMGYILRMTLSVIDGLVTDISETLSGEKKKSNEENASLIESIMDRFNGGRQVSNSTTKKGNASILQTQIAVISESKDRLRQRNNARSMAQSFDTLSDDNKLTYKRLSKPFNVDDYLIRGAERNKVSDLEVSNFLSIAGRDILERYNFIEKIETQEVQIPEDLRKGVMCIGDNIFRGMKQRAYLSNDREYKNLLLLLIGPTRAGKSNLISNLSVDAIENGECVIIFDFIENCELSNEVASLFPKDKVLEIRCDDFDKLQGLGYNEVGYSDNVFKQYENAKRQSTNLMALVNSINVSDTPLSPKMERYLESAALVVFINNGSIKDVFGVIQNHEIRANWISKVPKKQYENMNDYIENLRELDKTDTKGVIVGTNYQAGIIDRLNTLKRNTYMELMLKKGTENNVNLVDEMQKNQLITIKMPQSIFTTDGERDICTTYWISKIWLALQVRADKIRDKSKRTKVNLVIDELYQVSHTEQFLTSKLSQIAKFICKPIVSCHYINQLSYMRDELRSANTSYMLIAGCDKKNFDELKNELYPFTDEDLKNLKRYHSLNYIKDKEGYSRFITKLPGKVEDRVKNKLKEEWDKKQTV